MNDEAEQIKQIAELFFEGYEQKAQLREQAAKTEAVDISTITTGIEIKASTSQPDRIRIGGTKTAQHKRSSWDAKRLLVGILASDLKPKYGGNDVIIYYPSTDGESVQRLIVQMDTAATLLLESAKIAGIDSTTLLDEMSKKISTTDGATHSADAVVEIQKNAREKL